MRTAWTALLITLLAAPATAAEEPPCTIVFGQGRNASTTDNEANTLWDDVNLAFNGRVAARLSASGGAVIPIVLRVTATDLQANVDRLLARAAVEGCQRLVETTIFADYEAKTLVARIRQHPIVRDPASPRERPVLRIGAPSFVSERNFPLTQTTLDRVRPAALADEMAAELDAPRR